MLDIEVMQDIEIETHPLAPFAPSHARVLMLGSFPPPRPRWKMDFYYPNFQNDMWRIFGLVFFADKDHFVHTDERGKPTGFDQAKIEAFLTHTGIAIGDTAYQVRRLQGNASDKHLQVVTALDVLTLLEQLPDCTSIITTGDKACDTLISQLELAPTSPIDKPNIDKPKIGQPSQVRLSLPTGERQLSLHRLPSSSRAYPLALEKKARQYGQVFATVGLEVVEAYH